MSRQFAIVLSVILLAACRGEKPLAPSHATRPSILLVTLDTTRADSIGPEAQGVETPAFDAVAARGIRFRRAYAPVPQTLPSHASMFTGLYPAGHGVHENARHLDPKHPLVAERLRTAGYRTAAFVSAYPLGEEFGLARGFAIYDDELPPGRSERSAAETTERAIRFLETSGDGPFFLWVHYFDPHYPYEPPEGFRDRYAGDPYRGEIAAMDEQLGRLVAAFDRATRGSGAIVIAGDHGESLGEHGESQHGNLVYEGAMRVPLVVAVPGDPPRIVDDPVGIRRVHHTLLDLGGISAEGSLRKPDAEIVLGEAMQPFLQYGWQPQVMGIDGATKVIQSGGIEVYDLAADPRESRDLGSGASVGRALRKALREYPIPTPGTPAEADLDEEGRRQLASLGYVTSNAAPVIRPDAPRPRDMAHLFDDLERASALFTAGAYREAIPLLESILAADPHNVSTALRLAAAHSGLGENDRALEAFRRAEAIAPGSLDVQHYLALHYLGTGEWERAGSILERVVREMPARVPAIEGLAEVRERQGRLGEALDLRRRANALRTPGAVELIHTGSLAMAVGNTPVALEAFERARSMQGDDFRHQLELGVLYLDSGRLQEARAMLDAVGPKHPGYAMALFKRAQLAVLLAEPDRAARIAKAREHADPTTRELIAREKLFR